jgi:uncharacterized protein YndB with AHSA1/START domain
MDISFEVNIAAVPEKVFEAVTTKQGYQGWWTETCDINSGLNQESSIRFEKEDKTEEMCFKVLENILNKKLTWLCISNNVFPSWVGTMITFDIETAKNGTIMIFTQKSTNRNWHKHTDYQPSANGWEFFMNSLKNYCETGEGQQWSL